MRTLRFIVDGETLSKDPSCDFTGLFPKANPEVNAEFIFSPEWKNKVKAVAFWSILDNEYPPRVLEDNSCQIPVEALAKPAFKIQIYGKNRGRVIKTNKLIIHQGGGTI